MAALWKQTCRWRVLRVAADIVIPFDRYGNLFPQDFSPSRSACIGFLAVAGSRVVSRLQAVMN
ncbi:hypothetical protein DFP86_11574 [Paludibacterium purpuratum]|uniref:Uncharacterized protein n=1 Tax=Paludibacterium purpuratum TaxID=1144873 RepID=A0A4R7AYN3_9NEIS|nr:hypothetical protein DFP86_11574 [Paludibacterium purpuratum]